MGDVLQFTPRPKPAAPEAPEVLTGPALRASLEEAAQTALDAADRIIAVLDRMDGCSDKDGAAAEPSMTAPKNQRSQATWMHSTDQDREQEAPEAVLPNVAIEPSVTQVPPMRWGGRGNVIAVAGTMLLDLAGVH